MEWNVFIGGFNSRKIEVHNVFDHYRFRQDCKKAAKKFKDDKKAFAEAIRSSLMYYYWSKCEWEIIIDHWPQHDGWKCEKVDVFKQISINWPQFIDYCWDHRKEMTKFETIKLPKATIRSE